MIVSRQLKSIHDDTPKSWRDALEQRCSCQTKKKISDLHINRECEPCRVVLKKSRAEKALVLDMLLDRKDAERRKVELERTAQLTVQNMRSWYNVRESKTVELKIKIVEKYSEDCE